MLLCLRGRAGVAVVVESPIRSIVVMMVVVAILVLLIRGLVRSVAVGTGYDTMTSRCCINRILSSLRRLNLSLNLLVCQRVDLR